MLEQLADKVSGLFTRDAPSGENKDIKNVQFKNEIVSFVKKEFERRQEERVIHELQWQLCMCYLQGNQYVDIDSARKKIEEVPRLFWYSQREVYNHIAPIIETRMSKLNLVKPSMKVIPASTENKDVTAAKVCSSIVQGTSRKLRMSEKIKSATAWSEITGTVFYKQVWNPKAGRSIGDLEGSMVTEGDIEESVVPPYEIYPDSLFSQDIEYCKSIIHAKVFSIEEISDMWGVSVPGRELDVFTITQSNIGLGGLGYTANVMKISPTKKKNCELVIEYYEVPSTKFPEGRLIITAGTALLHMGELPYIVGEDQKRAIPIVKQVCIERPGYFFGTSIIERLIPVQRAYNATKNRKHEYLNRAAIGVLICEDGSVDLEDLQMDGLSPGKVIPLKPGAAPPHMLDNTSLPAEFLDEEQKLEELFVLISGVSEVSRYSGVPTGSGSGISLSILKEQDDSRLSLAAESIRLSLIRIGQQWLRLYKQFGQGPRILKFVGDNNDVQVLEFLSGDLTSDDVVMQTENELSLSIAQKRQIVYDLLNAGLFHDPDTGKIDKRMRAQIFKMLQFGDWESANDLDELHIVRAQRENVFLEQGRMPMIKDYDEHIIHIQEHNRFRLTTEYDELAMAAPPLTLMFDQHVAMHQQIFAVQLQAAMAQAAQSQGAPGESDKPNNNNQQQSKKPQSKSPVAQ